jgi:hypothetical protein
MAVLSAAIVALLAMVVLYHRTSREAMYINTIVVWAKDGSWEDATVEVTGENLPRGGFVSKLTAADHLACRFHVPPGRYAVVVKKDGRILDRNEKDLPPELKRVIWWPCSRPAAMDKLPHNETTR